MIILLLSKLYNKDVVNKNTGEKLGKIRDVEIDEVSGKINCLLISQHQSISSLIKKNKIKISFDNIEKIGDEVILVNTLL